MERCKNVAVRWFVSLCTDKEPAENVYDEFVEKATSVSSPRDCYADKFLCEESQSQCNEFMPMMFRDGCFILHFIHLVLHELSDYSYLNVPLILRDMFLLENQIPCSILSALMSLTPDKKLIEKNDIGELIDRVFLPEEHEYSNSSITWAWSGISSSFRKVVPSLSFIGEMLTYCKRNEVSRGEGSNSGGEEEDSDPNHLLDLLRSTLARNAPSSGRGYLNYYFRPIMELRAAGIEVSTSNSKCLSDIKYEEKLISGHLELPQIVVDDATKTRLLNLIAYEMCPDGLSDRMVTSYICFLDSLIDHAEDAKELRSKNILLNRIGSDEEVANLFNELANNLDPQLQYLQRCHEKHGKAPKQTCKDVDCPSDTHPIFHYPLDCHLFHCGTYHFSNDRGSGHLCNQRVRILCHSRCTPTVSGRMGARHVSKQITSLPKTNYLIAPAPITGTDTCIRSALSFAHSQWACTVCDRGSRFAINDYYKIK